MEGGPTMLDEMMRIARIVEKEEERLSLAERKEVPKDFANGLKKGFLSQASAKKSSKNSSTKHKKSEVKQREAREKEAREKRVREKEAKEKEAKEKEAREKEAREKEAREKEAREKEAMEKESKKREEIPLLKAKETANSSLSTNLQFPEVQAALAPENGSWMTPEFIERIRREPKLVRGLHNPRYMDAIDELHRNPAVIERYKDDPGLRDFLETYMGILGDHFQKLGEEEEKKRSNKIVERKTKMTNFEPDVMRGITIDHAKEAAERSGFFGKDRDKIASILSNPELSVILGDSAIRQVLLECQSNPISVWGYLSHPEIGPKLRKLAEAGLIRFE